MGKEIERRFLCKYIPDGFSTSVIKQGYIWHEKEKQLRVRVIDNKEGAMTLKFTENFERDEYEYEIPVEDAREIFSKCELKLTKIRHSSVINGRHIDIDEYPNGVMTAEIELHSADEEFEKPEFFGKEVTGVHEYSNIHIAKELKKLTE